MLTCNNSKAICCMLYYKKNDHAGSQLGYYLLSSWYWKTENGESFRSKGLIYARKHAHTHAHMHARAPQGNLRCRWLWLWGWSWVARRRPIPCSSEAFDGAPDDTADIFASWYRRCQQYIRRVFSFSTKLNFTKQRRYTQQLQMERYLGSYDPVL